MPLARKLTFEPDSDEESGDLAAECLQKTVKIVLTDIMLQNPNSHKFATGGKMRSESIEEIPDDDDLKSVSDKYTRREKKEMCEFVLQILRESPEQLKSHPGCKLWTLAHERGLFLRRPVRSLIPAFRLAILPHLREYLADSEDRRLILLNLKKLGIGSRKESIAKEIAGPKINKTVNRNEKVELCNFLLRKSRESPKFAQNCVNSNVWTLAHDEGLFTNLGKRRLKAMFESKIVPNLRQYVPNADDRQLLIVNFDKFGIRHKLKSRMPSKANDNRTDLVRLCTFIIEKLRDWPERKIDEMRGPILHRLWQLAEEEGLSIKYTAGSFALTFRYRVLPNLDDLVPDPEENRLIRSNLLKLGVGVKSLPKTDTKVDSADDRIEPETSCIEVGLPEKPNSSDQTQSPANKTPPDVSVTNQNLNELDLSTASSTAAPFTEKCSSRCRHKTEISELKQLLRSERKRKLAHCQQIADLSEQLAYHQRETVKHQKLSYELKSRSVELENEIVTLKCQLWAYKKRFERGGHIGQVAAPYI